MAFRTFVRTWWKRRADGSLEPEAGEKRYTGNSYPTRREARDACEEFNRKHKPRSNELGEKMEFEEAA